MSPSLVDADSLLVIDVGSVTTRAALFDVVDGRYRFIASGSAATTAGAPFHDVGEGVHRAIEQLQATTGRSFISTDGQLILPTAADGSGVDAFAATISAGPPFKVVAVGLLEDVSLESALNLAATTYCGTLETLSLNDTRKTETRIDNILHMRPDLVVVTGGTEGGASQSILKLLEPVRMACEILPREARPELLFAGNGELHESLAAAFQDQLNITYAPNVRPVLEMEQLGPAQMQIARLSSRIRARKIPGVRELDGWSQGHLLPSATAFGRLVRFISKAYSSNKGVLGVDIGASATTLAAAFGGELVLGAYPTLGLGKGLERVLEQVQVADVLRWLPMEISAETVREYIYNKAIFPAGVPATVEEVAIEQSLARLALQAAVKKITRRFPASVLRSASGLLPWFEPILASGSVLTRSPGLAHTALTLLDGLQPTGTTTLVLDQNHLAAALGVAAGVNPVLTTQVLDSNTFQYLGTVISPVGGSRPGTPVLRLKMVYENGQESSLEVKQGSLETLPLAPGQTARLHLHPLHKFEVGMGGLGRGGRLDVHGGALGVIIDARGRPLELPEDSGRRQETLRKWLNSLGG